MAIVKIPILDANNVVRDVAFESTPDGLKPVHEVTSSQLATEATISAMKAKVDALEVALLAQAKGTAADPTVTQLSGSSVADADALPVRLIGATYARQQGNLVSAVGDSVTSQAGPENQRNALGYLNWLGLLTDQRARWSYQSAGGGYTSAAVLSLMVPALLARSVRPNYAIVLAGTNDLSAVTTAETIRNLEAIYYRLSGAGILPIVATLPPNSNTAYHEGIAARNVWIAQHASERGYPLLDFHRKLTAADGTYLVGLSNDGVHPNEEGAKIMGQLAADVLSPLLPDWSVPLASTNTDPTLLNINPLFLTDTDSNGVPDGWGTIGSTTGGVISLVAPEADEELLGNWLRVERTADATGQIILRAGGFAVTPGDRLALGFRVKTSGVEAGGGKFLVDLIEYGVAANRLAGPLYSWPTEIDEEALWYGEFTVPAGVVNTQLQLNFTSGQGAFSVGQMTYRNLTALGLA